MKRNEPVSHIMKREVITVHHGDPISTARKAMQEHGIHHLPVVSGQALIGIITHADILRVSFGDAFDADQRAVDATLDHTLTLEEVMEKSPKTIAETTTIREAAQILGDGNIHSLPVVRGEKLVGIVTSTDLLRYLADLL